MQVNTDNKQRIKATMAFILEFYKVIMGTFLTAFVPRTCNDNVCTVMQNIYDDNLFHRIALSFNAFSFLTFIAVYYNEICREEWCIKYLDIDQDKSNTNLDDEIEEYPKLKLEMNNLNTKYANYTKLCGAVQVINIGLSLSDIVNNWSGSASLTPLISYIILIFMKLFQAYSVSSIAVKNECALSAYLTGPRTYNTIDEDYKRIPENEELTKKNTFHCD